jgi:cell division protein FtsW
MFGKKKIRTHPARVRETVSSPGMTPINYALILLVIFLTIFGLLMVFSSSAVISYIYYDGDTFYFFKRQIIWIIIGVVFATIAYFIPVKTYRTFSVILLGISLLLLLYTLPEAIFKLEMPFVKTVNGAARWIDLGFFDLQPAEIFKLGIVLFTATFMTMSKETEKVFKKLIDQYKRSQVIYSALVIIYTFFPIIVVGLGSLMILGQKDLDTIVIAVLSFLVVYYIGGTTRLHTISSYLVVIMSFIIGSIASLFVGYRKSRVNAFMQIILYGEPSDASKAGESFQVWNGLIAIGSGGLFGVGYGESRLKLFFLQEAAYTDSIFAIIGEEFGLMGTLLIIVGFLFFMTLGIFIASTAEDKFSGLIAIGITAWITIQAFLNIAANISVIPFGGMPLPFFSYGGSNTIMILVGIGILLNIGKNSKAKIQL